MKLKGIIQKPDGTDTEGFCEIVNINITEPTVSVAVHLYYYEGQKKVYQPIDGSIAKRYVFDYIESPDTYRYCYECLLTIERFKNFIII